MAPALRMTRSIKEKLPIFFVLSPFDSRIFFAVLNLFNLFSAFFDAI
jgi:hypothetical protein